MPFLKKTSQFDEKSEELREVPRWSHLETVSENISRWPPSIIITDGKHTGRVQQELIIHTEVVEAHRLFVSQRL